MENALLIRCIRYAISVAILHIYFQFKVVGKAICFLQVKINNWKQLSFVTWENSAGFGYLCVYFWEAINHIQATQNGVCAYLCILAFQSDQQIVCIKMWCGVQHVLELNNSKKKITTRKEPLSFFESFIFCHLEIIALGILFLGAIVWRFCVLFYFFFNYMVQVNSSFIKICIKVEEYLRILFSVSS